MFLTSGVCVSTSGMSVSMSEVKMFLTSGVPL